VRYLTVNEAAAELQLSVPTIKRYVYEGKLRSTKLPGGQHRIPASEIERLLSPEGVERPVASESEETALDARLAVIERWMTELQADIERIEATLEVISRFCSRAQPAEAEEPMSQDEIAPHRVLVLGPGCKRCDALYEVARKVLDEQARTDVSLERITHLDDIAAFGPILTPALAVDEKLIVSGRVPSESALRKMIEQRLA
jgi:small redox-active disulfide protein 2